MEELLCPWGPAKFLIFSENIPPLLHYSHFIAIIAALLVGIFVFLKNKENTISKLLLSLFLLFSFWAFIDVVIWATNRTDIVMFWWSLIILIEPLIYALAFYLFFYFVYKKYPSFKINLIIGLLLTPLILLVPTSFNLESINIAWCDASEGPLAAYYTYFLEVFFIIGIIAITVSGIRKLKTKVEKARIFYFALGLIFFLAAFTSGNIIGSITDDWDLAQYGLFGMPVFIGILAYLIVQYKVFNLKVFGAQALVAGLWILIGSLLFVVKSELSRIVTLITFVLLISFGFVLVRSVKKEIEIKEKAESLARDLEIANKAQEDLLHFISHQIKGFLTKSRNIFAEMMEGTFGPISGDVKNIAEQGLKINTDGVNTVQTILNAANIRTGKLSYNMSPIDLRNVIQKSFEKNRKSAESKSLDFVLNIDETSEYKIKGDENQLLEAFSNLIDNSIKYTPKGEVRVSLVKSDNKIQFSVKDTGIGIAPEDKSKLFTEGGRGKNALEVNVDSTGFGLYIVKNIIEAHGGKVWVESEGEGRGSEFVVEMPAKLGG